MAEERKLKNWDKGCALLTKIHCISGIKLNCLKFLLTWICCLKCLSDSDFQKDGSLFIPVLLLSTFVLEPSTSHGTGLQFKHDICVFYISTIFVFYFLIHNYKSFASVCISTPIPEINCWYFLSIYYSIGIRHLHQGHVPQPADRQYQARC